MTLAKTALLPPPGATLLTPTDRDLLTHLANGHTTTHIATHAATTPDAIRQRISSLLRRTGTRDRTHLVATALRCGWIT